MATDHSGTSTRVHMAVAYLDGKRPSLITQTGLYENERFHAWDPATCARSGSSTATAPPAAPARTMSTSPMSMATAATKSSTEPPSSTPTARSKWSIYRAHPDIVAIKHILPGTKGRQVFYVVETSTHAGAYLVDAATGKIIWKVNREDDPRWTHAHIGWAADISPRIPAWRCSPTATATSPRKPSSSVPTARS
jgi:rhamnogalacturonan endolyase